MAKIFKICDYGCGQEAKYQFKNGKWCCSNSTNQCAEIKRQNSEANKIQKKYNDVTTYSGLNICDYGCGQQAKYQFKNGKLCCNKTSNCCPEIKRQNSEIGRLQKYIEITTYSGLNLCDYGCGQKALFQFKNGKLCCSKTTNSCPKIKKQNSETNKIKQSGKNNGMHGKFQSIESKRKNSKSNKKVWQNEFSIFNSKEYRKKLSNSCKLSIEQIKEKYFTFAKEEEMRYDPNKPIEEKVIQVHCKNSNCENSKEKDGWFTPIGSQLSSRMYSLDKEDGNDGSYLYCSQHCKDTCPLYGLQYDPFKKSTGQYRSQVWNDAVLKQDSFECQICGSKENLHCHHIRPVKLEPELSLDPDNGIVLCQTCHIKYGHKVGTECSLSNLAKKKCNKNMQ